MDYRDVCASCLVRRNNVAFFFDINDVPWPSDVLSAARRALLQR
jgi:hypothetical protein